MRKAIPQLVRDHVVGFYGRECVVYGGPEDGTLHHIDGNHSNSFFENLVPLGHTLHAGLRVSRPTRKAKLLNQTDGLLSSEQLLEIVAPGLYLRGETTRAFACARLAYAMSRYYRKRNAEVEMRSLVDALHYLRRCFILRPALGQRLLHHILSREIIPTVKEHPALSPVTVLMMVEEMGCWLNECGASGAAQPVLDLAEKLAKRINPAGLRVSYRSGLLRQKSFGLIYAGRSEKIIDRILAEALEIDDSNQNKVGIANVQVTLQLRENRGTKALEIVEQLLVEVEKKLAADLLLPKKVMPEKINCRYENYLGLLATRLIAYIHVHQKTLTADQVRNLLSRQNQRETGLAAKARYIITPAIAHAFRLKGEGGSAFRDFVIDHTAPRIQKAIVADCVKVVREITK